jgi:hypothetical protein
MICAVNLSAGRWAALKKGVTRGLSVALLSAASGAPGASASQQRVNVNSLQQALQNAPVQVVDHPLPTLSSSEVRSLRDDIARVDRGRIWVAVVPAMDANATSDLSNALSGYLNANGGGAVIVVAGPTVWGSTSWEDGPGARARLQAAFQNGNAPLVTELRQAVESFASGDAAAGHPQLNQPAPSPSPRTATPPGSSAHHAGGSSVGLIIGLAVLGAVLLGPALAGGRRVRRAIRASHRRKEERADAQAQAQSDFSKLGEQIGALDIDSSMPNASARGKDEYAKAIECYQDAERRLKSSDDEYQFERALGAIKQGLEHVDTADQLFNGSGQEPTGGDFDKLAALHDRGVLSDAEFEQQKQKLLEQRR